MECPLIYINWIGVIIAAVSAFAIGGLWYSPLLFGPVWQKEVKVSDEEIKNSNKLPIFGGAFIMMFISALFLDFFLPSGSSAWNGLLWGLIISIGWIATAIGVNFLFSRRSLKLFAIDAAYYVVLYAVMGLILGAMK